MKYGTDDHGRKGSALVMAILLLLTMMVMTYAFFHVVMSANRQHDAGLTIELTRNPDILAELCERKGDRFVIGFAAESHDLVASAQRKIARKGCDLLVANDIRSERSGFDTDDNAVVFVWPDGQIEELPSLPKRDVAAQLLDRVAKSRGKHE